MVPVIEVHPSPYVVGGQQPMVLMKERHFAVRRGCTATHGFQVGALPCIVADSYQRFLSRNTISQNAGVWYRSESNNEKGGGGSFLQAPSTKRRKDKLFPQFRPILELALNDGLALVAGRISKNPLGLLPTVRGF